MSLIKDASFWDLVIYHSCVIRNNSQRLTCLTDGRKWIPDWIVERLSPQTRLSIPLLTYLHHVVLRDEVSGVSKGDSRIWEKWLSLETFRFGIPIILDEPGYFLSLPNFEICKKTWGISLIKKMVRMLNNILRTFTICTFNLVTLL